MTSLSTLAQRGEGPHLSVLFKLDHGDDDDNDDDTRKSTNDDDDDDEDDDSMVVTPQLTMGTTVCENTLCNGRISFSLARYS